MRNIRLSQSEIKEKTQHIKESIYSNLDVRKLHNEIMKCYEMCPTRIVTKNGIFLSPYYQNKVNKLKDEKKRVVRNIIKFYCEEL